MKKYVVYVGILLAGLLLGWLLFGNKNNSSIEHNSSNEQVSNKMWTCSMHPQVMQPEPGDCPICGMDLIPAEAGDEGLSPDEFKLSKNAMALANIQTSKVGNENNLDGMVKLSGKISANENANMVQASYFSGRIEELKISSVGEKVKRGQLLAKIYSPELFAAQQELITASSIKETQPELYQAVRSKLKLLKISDGQINQIESSGKVIENFPVYATVSGTVSDKMVSEGDYVNKGQALLKISNLNTVWALFDVYENQIDLFKKGQEITITTNAYPAKEFIQKVDFIDPVMNSQTRTVKLRVVLKNSSAEFKPGMFVEGTLKMRLNESDNMLSIPSSAVLWTGKRSVVYVKTNSNEGIFSMREVELGNKIGENYEIISGLKSGEEVVINGAFTVDAAAQLQGKKSMMNKEGANTINGHEGHDMPVMSKDLEWSTQVQEAFRPTIDAYIQLKDALIQSDPVLTASKSEALMEVLNAIPENIREQTHNYWLVLFNLSSDISGNDELTVQRNYFQNLSDKLIEMVRNFEEVESKLYVQFCPMADNNKGAFWLSEEEQIRNPYFGDAMLKCGSVKQVIE